MARKNFGDGALRLLGPTTSTGFGLAASIAPSQTLTAQASASAATGSFTVQTSLDGVTWSTLIGASTFPVAGITVSSTSVDLFTQVRAAFTIAGSTADMSLFVAGR
jgi:formate/nitrite transporter FocA (FNT family)